MSGPPHQLFRPKLAVAYFTVLWVVVAMVGFFQIVTPSAKWGVRLTGCLLLPAGAWLARCGYRLVAVLTEEGVEIRGFTRTRRVDLSAIDRAYVGSGRTIAQSTRTLHLVLKTGADLRFQVISVFRNEAKIEAVVEAINLAVSHARDR